jgi:predicted aspartyl protease
MIRAGILVLLLCFALFPGWASADIYSWIDDQGTQHYTTDAGSIPEPYRTRVQTLSLPPAPSPPPAMDIPPSVPQRSIVKISFAADAPVLVGVKINGAGPVTMILDTGADRTLIRPSALEKIGVPRENASRVMIKGVTGTDYADAIWINSIEVGETKVGPLLVIVHEIELKGVEGLLGRDFLANFNVTIDPKEQIVTLTPN